MATTYEVTGGLSYWKIEEKLNGNVVSTNSFSKGSGHAKIQDGIVKITIPKKDKSYSIPIADLAVPANDGTTTDVDAKLRAIIYG